MVICSFGAFASEIAGDVGELRQRAQLVQQLLRPLVQLVDIGVLQACIESCRGRCGAPTLMSWVGCRNRLTPCDLGKLRPQPVDDLRGVELALVARLEHDEEAAGIGRIARCRSSRSTSRSPRCPGSRSMHVADLVHAAASSLSARSPARPRRSPEIIPVSWIGKKPFGNVDRHDHRQRHGGEEHAERDRLMAQHDVERAPVERQHARRSRASMTR